jgi:hypothetical protein
MRGFVFNLLLVVLLSSSLTGCAALQEWFESMMSVQEEQEQ